MRTLTQTLGAIAVTVALATAGAVPSPAAEPGTDPLGSWSEERLRAATPEQHTRPGSAEALALDADEASRGAWGTVVTRTATVGRLFFRTPTGDASCTAAVVNSASKNLIITAAHCVHPGGPGKAYYGDFLFAPGWNDGPSAHGYWSGTAALASAEWTQSKRWDHDYAFVRLAANNGEQIVNRVGGNALAAGTGHVVPNTRIWGYPARAPYTGQTAQYCDVTTTRENGYTPDARAACGFTQGSSGGPWLKDVQASGTGYIWAVTSRCESGPGVLDACAGTAIYASPLPAAVFTLRDAVGGV